MANKRWVQNDRVAIRSCPSIRGYVLAIVQSSATQENEPLYTVQFDQGKYSQQNYTSEMLIAEVDAVKMEAETKAKAVEEKGK